MSRPARSRAPKPEAPSQARSQRGTAHATSHRADDDLDAYIKEMVERLPPLSSEQRDRLAQILRSDRRT